MAVISVWRFENLEKHQDIERQIGDTQKIMHNNTKPFMPVRDFDYWYYFFIAVHIHHKNAVVSEYFISLPGFKMCFG